jgi:CheY-like chemotaxis protein
MARILVVEDDPQVRQLVVRILQRSGYQVCVAVDGLEAQRKFAQRPPDLVLTDLHMPGLDGAALAKWIQAQKSTPIVIMTAAIAPDGIANRVLGKPFTIQALTETVQTALQAA